MFTSKDPINKARVLEHKADQARDKGKHKKALQLYQEALEIDDQRLELYDKIIDLHKEYVDDWTEEDFAYNLALTMAKQEIEDPTFKRINARHEPEYDEIRKLIKKVLDAKTTKTETKHIEEIVEFGDLALYPLIDCILGFKTITQKGGKKTKATTSKNPNEP